jgi:hypothetical protein
MKVHERHDQTSVVIYRVVIRRAVLTLPLSFCYAVYETLEEAIVDRLLSNALNWIGLYPAQDAS